MTVRAAMFDLDGTLVDSLEDLTDAVNHMLAGFGRPPLTSASVRRLVGKGAHNLVRRALETESEEAITRGIELFVAYNSDHVTDKSLLYPGVREALLQLAENGIRLVVISNKHEAICHLIMEALGIARLFEIICDGDTFPEMKPSPLPLLQALERLALPPKMRSWWGTPSTTYRPANRQAYPPLAAPGATAGLKSWLGPTIAPLRPATWLTSC